MLCYVHSCHTTLFQGLTAHSRAAARSQVRKRHLRGVVEWVAERGRREGVRANVVEGSPDLYVVEPIGGGSCPHGHLGRNMRGWSNAEH